MPFTTFTPIPGATRIIYVSNAGLDSNSGSSTAPKATIAAAFALVREGFPDWILLNRGDTFTQTQTLQWNKAFNPETIDTNGLTPWMRFGAYGNPALPRPIVNTGIFGALVITPGFQSNRPQVNFAVESIHFRADTRLANVTTTIVDAQCIFGVAANWRGNVLPLQNILIENVRIEGYGFGISMVSPMTDLVIRRNLIHYCFLQTTPGGNLAEVSAIIADPEVGLVEENVIYRVQSPNIPGMPGTWNSRAHAMYIGQNGQTTVRDNIIIEAPEGCMQRCGGIAHRNVAVHTNIGGLSGQAFGVRPTPGGVNADIYGNLWLNVEGVGFFLGNCTSGILLSNHIITDSNGILQFPNILMMPKAVSTNNGVALGVNEGVHNVTFKGNYGHAAPTYNPLDTLSYSNLEFSANNWAVPSPLLTDIATYLISIGQPPGDYNAYANLLLTRDINNYGLIPDATSIINFYRAALGLPPL